LELAEEETVRLFLLQEIIPRKTITLQTLEEIILEDVVQSKIVHLEHLNLEHLNLEEVSQEEVNLLVLTMLLDLPHMTPHLDLLQEVVVMAAVEEPAEEEAKQSVQSKKTRL